MLIVGNHPLLADAVTCKVSDF